MHRILCVDDSPETLMILEATLKGHHLHFAKSLKEATNSLEKETFALLLLDIDLPDGKGFDIVSRFSQRLTKTPVFFLTGAKDFSSKVTAFNLGAEDFIVKPFDPQELKLRVDAKLRKVDSDQDNKSLLRVGPLLCNIQEQRVLCEGGQPAVDLTSLEFRIFHLLAQAPQKIFSRSEILERVWGHSISVTDRAVDVHISNLRKRLQDTGVGIEAIVGTGYRIRSQNSPKEMQVSTPSL